MSISFIKKFIFIVSLVINFSAWSSSTFNEIYVFGDSLSDTGNLASVTQAFPAPFFNNRVSNGPNAVDNIAQHFGLNVDPSLHLIGPSLGTNYAVSGARAASNESIDLPTQISAFLLNKAGRAPVDALYIIFIGGNDVRDARDSARVSRSIRIIRNAVRNESSQIQKLITAGAKNIMVFNIADIGRIPDTTLLTELSNNNRLARKATNYTRLYNVLLSIRMRLLEHKNNINITEFDFFKVFSKILDNPSDFDFTNSTQACFSQLSFSFNSECNFGASFGEFVFFDEIHPTARAHELLGSFAVNVILQSYKDH